MTEQTNLVPKRRFKEFQNTRAWEQRKLGELADFSKGNGYSKGDLVVNGSPIILYGRLYVNYETVINVVDTFVEIKDKSVISEGNEVIVPSSGETSEDISRASVVGKSGIVLGGDLNIIKPKSEIDPIFLALTISNGKQQKEMSKRAQGKSVVHLHNSDLKQVSFIYPKLQEQQKIGQFFVQLDHLITLHQRKLEKTKALKSAYLSEMLPAEGERVPKRRFSGFTQAWEQRKFQDDIVSIQTGTNLLGSESNGGIPLIKMGNIQRGYFSLDKLEYLDDSETVSESDIINNGDFLFNTRNTLELVGKGATWFCESGKYAFNSNIARFTFKNINTYFFNYLYNTEQVIKQVRARAVGTTSVAAVYPRDLNSMKYMVPSIEEQSEIGNFFKRLDYTITLHQRKLEKLQNIKKAYLNEMFV